MNVYVVFAATVIMGTVDGLLISGAYRTPKKIGVMLQDTSKQRKLLIVYLLSLGICIYSYFWFQADVRGYIKLISQCAYLVAILPDDCRNKTIDLGITAVFAMYFLILQVMTFDKWTVLGALAGAGIAFVVLGIPYLIRRESIGVGDIFAVACCGLLLGFYDTLTFLFKAMIIGLIFSAVRLLMKKVNLKSEIPFAPFLLIAGLI